MTRGVLCDCGVSCGFGEITCTGALGKLRSTPTVAYVSTVTAPAFAVATLYLPRLNPATGMGRSDLQRETCSPGRTAEPPVAVAPALETGSSLPVATSVQGTG